MSFEIGGASIALALVNATANVDAASHFVARDGGQGGNGGGGQIGQTGGIAGPMFASECSGGNAGSGGSGGGGGGGAGGLSVGILWTGIAPTIDGETVQNAPIRDGITLHTGKPGGKPGQGGAPVLSLPAPNDKYLAGKTGTTDGKPGIAQAVLGL